MKAMYPLLCNPDEHVLSTLGSLVLALLEGKTDLPISDMYVVHEAAPDRDLPAIIRIDCAGLGGHDLGGPDPWHICIRSDRHGQNIYGPSLATTEAVLHHPQRRPRHIVALGLTKAMHEFLTLHYFAIDSVAMAP